MRRIKVYLGIGFANADHSEVLEVEDDVPDSEIQEMVEEWANNYIEIDWTEAT